MFFGRVDMRGERRGGEERRRRRGKGKDLVPRRAPDVR